MYDKEVTLILAKLSLYIYSIVTDFDTKFLEDLLESELTINYFTIPKTGANILLIKNNKANIIIFRGSESKKDWLYNALFVKQNKLNGFFVYGESRVHSGFLNQYISVEEIICEFISDNDYPVYCSGHSMGSSMATLCALYLNDINNRNTILYTFASPRVGNYYFKKSIQKSNIEHYRFVNGKDIVTMIPKINFYHISNPINIGRKKWWKLCSINDHKMSNYIKSLNL